MSNYSQRMADMLLADQARWQARQDAENAPLAESRAALDSYECERPLLRGTGLIPQNPSRTKTPNREPRSRAHGAAAMPPNADAAERLAAGNVEATVLCYNASDPTNVEVRTVASFRGSRDSAKNRAPVTATARTVDTARFSTGHDFNN